jgi:hypothetical protein
VPVPPPGPKMNPVPYENFVMPTIDDTMFHGFDITRLPPFGSARAPRRSRKGVPSGSGIGSGSGTVTCDGDMVMMMMRGLKIVPGTAMKTTPSLCDRYHCLLLVPFWCFGAKRG